MDLMVTREIAGVSVLVKQERQQCRCGLTWDPLNERDCATHDRVHTRWLRGVPLPRQAFAGQENGVVVAPLGGVTMMENGVVQLLADLLHPDRDTPLRHWLPYSAAARHGADATDHRATAFVALRERTAVGILVARRRRQWGLWDRVNDAERVIRLQALPRQALESVFVCYEYRRQGIALELIDTALAQLEMTPATVAWGAPLTANGRRVLKHRVDDKAPIYVSARGVEMPTAGTSSQPSLPQGQDDAQESVAASA